jgi:hypothetical protein
MKIKIKHDFECWDNLYYLATVVCYVNFTNFDGVVEIIWHTKICFYATLKSKTNLNL